MNKYIIEQYNVSDESYLLTQIYVKDKQAIQSDDLLFSLESSKMTIEIESKHQGIFRLNPIIEKGTFYDIGTILGYITESPEDDVVFEKSKQNELNEHVQVEEIEFRRETQLIEIADKRITKEALEIIKERNINITQFAEYSLITKKTVQNIETSIAIACDVLKTKSSKKKLAIIGAGTGAIQTIDLIMYLRDVEAVVIYDDTPSKIGKLLMNVPIKDKVDIKQIVNDYKDGIFSHVVNSVSTNIEFRKRIFEKLILHGLEFCNLIHPSVVMGSEVKLGKGNIIFPFNHIGAFTEIGNDCFITSHCNIEHHNILGNHCTFGPGVNISGHVTIGNEVKFGAGIFIEPKVIIGNNCIISSGSIINYNISDNSILQTIHEHRIKPVNSKKHD